MDINLIIVAVYSYFLGSIPFGLVLTKIFLKKDIRNIGSGNIGTTNVLRTGKKSLAIATLVLDLLKGYFSVIVTLTYFENLTSYSALICLIGHIFPIWLKFKGGKGIATTLGLFFAVSPWSMIAMGVGFVGGLYIIRNMIWGVFFGIITPMVFLVIFLKSPIYLLLNILLLIVVPKYINHSISIKENFKFRKEATLKDLFTPKKR